jgi:hypothetical protein
MNDNTIQESVMIELYDLLFQNFGSNKITIKSLNELLNESVIVKILIEIEPEILTISGVEEIKLISNRESQGSSSSTESINKDCQTNNNMQVLNINIGNKISNFIEILGCLSKYFNNCPTKNKLKENFKLKNLIRVNELIKSNFIQIGEKSSSNINNMNNLTNTKSKNNFSSRENNNQNVFTRSPVKKIGSSRNVIGVINASPKNKAVSGIQSGLSNFNSIFNSTNSLSNIPSSYLPNPCPSKDLITFGEILLTLSAVSSKRTEYLDTLCVISESEEKYLNNYLTILEKYLIFQEEGENNVQINNASFILANSGVSQTLSNNKTVTSKSAFNPNKTITIHSHSNKSSHIGSGNVNSNSNSNSNMNNPFSSTQQILNSSIIKKTQIDFTTRRMSNFKKKVSSKKLDDKNDFFRTVENYERQISELKDKNEELTDELLELELRYRDVLRENESLKYSSSKHYQMEQDSYNDAILITQLKNELMKRELEIEDVKRDNELSVKRLKEDIVKLHNEKDKLEDKLEEFKNVKFENEKFKLKIKELNLIKEKLHEYENISLTIEVKNKQIENLIKEKQNFINETENLIKENLADKEKIKDIEFEKKKLEYEVYDLKKDLRKSSRRGSKYTGSQFYNTSKPLSHFNIQNTTREGALNSMINFNTSNNFVLIPNKEKDTCSTNNKGFLLEKLQDLSNLNIEEKDNLNLNICTNNQLNQIFPDTNLEEELNNLQIEYEELNRLYREQVEESHKISEQNSEMHKICEKLKFENDVLKNEKEKILIDIEKIEISKQKVELQLSKTGLIVDKVENEKMKLLDELNQYKDKNKLLIEEKNLTYKDFESHKVLLKMKNNQIDKILSEKQKLMDDYQKLNLKYDKLKSDKTKEKEFSIDNSLLNANINNTISISQSQNIGINSLKNYGATTPKFKILSNGSSKIPSHQISPKNSTSNSELIELRGEVARLKIQITNKEDTIKSLKERVKNLEKLESIVKSKDSKAHSDLQHYKKSYEEQKLRMNQEHEVLSNNLCDLAMQFMFFKNQLLKNIKPSILKSNTGLTFESIEGSLNCLNDLNQKNDNELIFNEKSEKSKDSGNQDQSTFNNFKSLEVFSEN